MRKTGKRKMALAATAAPLTRGRIVKKQPREVLADLRNRAGLKSAEVARALGYASTNGYIRYEYPEYGDKLIPYKIAKKLLTVFVGRGTPAITADEIIAISDARTLAQDAPQVVAKQQSSLSQAGALRVLYRAEPGVFFEATALGTRVYGESTLLPAFGIDVHAQFAVAVSGDPKQTVLHCVRPDQVGVQGRIGKRCVVSIPRGSSGLVEVTISAFDDKGSVPAGSVIGVVIGSYSRE